MPLLHGIRASIRHDAKPLPECAVSSLARTSSHLQGLARSALRALVEVTSFNTVTCYVKSHAGREVDVIFERDGYQGTALDGVLSRIVARSLHALRQPHR